MATPHHQKSHSEFLPGTGEYAVEHSSPQKSRRGKEDDALDTWENDVHNDDFQKDFDWHGNLQHFDKAKIFAQIKVLSLLYL